MTFIYANSKAASKAFSEIQVQLSMIELQITGMENQKPSKSFSPKIDLVALTTWCQVSKFFRSLLTQEINTSAFPLRLDTR
jgi:hypothetical protein